MSITWDEPTFEEARDVLSIARRVLERIKGLVPEVHS
jgi:hypothetical protein